MENGSRRRCVVFIIFAVAFLALVVAVVFLLGRAKEAKENTPFVIPATFDTKNSLAGIAATLGEEYAVFRHPHRGFSVEYHKELIIERYEEDGGGETLVFREPELRENIIDKVGFQVYATPFFEEVISRERILKDIPNKAIVELQTVTVNPEAEVPVHGLLFWSEAPEIGKTREVWFAHGGYLYAITTYAHLDLWLAKILSTWRFEK